MPYDPQTRYDASPLYNGLSTAGAGIASMLHQMEQNKQQRQFNAQQIEDFKNMSGPDGQPVIDTETADKLLQGSQSQQKAGIADALFKMQYLTGRQDELAKNGPPSLMNFGGKQLVVSPKTGQMLPLDRNGPVPEPTGPIYDVKDDQGKTVQQRQWDPYTRQWKVWSTRPAPTNMMEFLQTMPGGNTTPPQADALAGGAGKPGAPAAPSAPAGGAAPAAPAAPSAPTGARQIKTTAERDALAPGTIYVGPDGVARRKK